MHYGNDRWSPEHAWPNISACAVPRSSHRMTSQIFSPNDNDQAPALTHHHYVYYICLHFCDYGKRLTAPEVGSKSCDAGGSAGNDRAGYSSPADKTDPV